MIEIQANRRRQTIVSVLAIGLALIAGLLLLAGFVRILPALVRIPDSYDFAAYYVAARVLNMGGSLYNPNSMDAAATVNGSKIAFPLYIYPPFFAALLRPLAVLPFTIAKTIWFVFNLVCLGCSVGLLARLIGLSRIAVLPLTLTALILPPIYDTLLLGQVNLLLLLLISASLYLSSYSTPHRRWDIAAGVLLGIAAAIKLYPIVIGLSFLTRHRFTALISMVGGGIAMLVFGLIAGGGLDNTVRYFTQVLPGFSGGGPNAADLSIWPVMARLFSMNQFDFAFLTTDNHVLITVRPIINVPVLGYILALLGSIAIAIFTIRTLIMRAHHTLVSRSLLPEFSLTMTLTLLTFPIIHDHYLTLSLIPVALVIRHYQRAEEASVRRSIGLILIVFALCLALQRYWRVFLNIVPSALLLIFGFCGMLLLWLTLLRLAKLSLSEPNRAFEQ